MSSLHAAGGLLLMHPASPVVCPLLRARCTTTATSRASAASAAAAAAAAAPPPAGSRFAGLRRLQQSAPSSPSLTSPVIRFGPAAGKGAIMPKKRSWLSKLGFKGSNRAAQTDPSNGPSQGPDDDKVAPGLQFATFGAGCFWGPELAFQRVQGVSKTEVGYCQGFLHNPTYGDVCDGDTGHVEVVRVQYDPNKCTYQNLLDTFLAHHDPTTLNRQGGDVGTQYRSGIYYYTPEQEKSAKDSLEAHQAKINKKIVTEVLPAKKFYRAEEYHQQYLSKGGRFGFRQSADKGCNDSIRCYG